MTSAFELLAENVLSTRLTAMAFEFPDGLSQAEREWLIADEARWRRAKQIASQRADLDVGDLYHALCNLERSPGERLRRGLRRPNESASVGRG